MCYGNKFQVIESLYPRKVEVALTEDWGLVECLYAEERVLIGHAIGKRQGEFAAGRLCAKEALARLGIEVFPILKDGKGAPVWPEGVSGSISHAKGCCAAVVARVAEGESLGLDIEEVNRLTEDIWEYSFVRDEIEWLSRQGGEAQKWASVIFSAKEAFYKAQYPISRAWLGFQDVVIEIKEQGEAFTVRLLVDVGKWKAGMEFKGKYGFFSGYVASGIWIG